MTEDNQFPTFGTRYQPLRKIARGGMADVYEARDLLLDRLVALKVLFSELSTNPTFVERFRREAQAAAALSHPNIVSVFDWGPANNTYFIAMELIEGVTLAKLIKENGQLAPARAAAIASDVALALGFAHRHGVIHRDIKPSNVLIADDGIVKVADFGIARAVTNEEDLTQTGSVLGTASYISPEQAKGEDLDGRSDIYSLGVVLYEMVTGTIPFMAETPLAVAYKHVTEPAVAPRKVNKSVPQPLEAIIMKCLSKDRTKRYSDAKELRADLLRFLENAPVNAMAMAAVAAPTQEIRSANVDRTQFISAIDSTSSIPIVEDPGQQHKKSRKKWWFLILLLLIILAIAGAILVPKLLAKKLPPPVAKFPVPSVIGATEQGATSLLQQNGFKVTVNFARSSQPAGTVVAESPQANTLEPKGTLVTLTVSSGPAKVAVPNVVGEAASNAEAKLLALGFNVSTNYQSANAAQGTVVGESPHGGTQAGKGSTVVLTVSNGPAKVAVPNVVDESLATASNKLGVAGLSVGTVTDQPSATVPQGDVISTSPSAGTQVAPNSSVDMVVSSGSTATVPNVVGDSQQAATQAIDAAGLSVGTVTDQPSATVPQGDVISTSPSAGTQVTAGSSVNLVVSNGTSTGAPPGQPNPPGQNSQS
jgi:serine/threonine-protein kinase